MESAQLSYSINEEKSSNAENQMQVSFKGFETCTENCSEISDIKLNKEEAAEVAKPKDKIILINEPINETNLNRTSKRTRQRADGSKSILQNAIARKEKSLFVDDKPRYRQKRIKQKNPIEKSNKVSPRAIVKTNTNILEEETRNDKFDNIVKSVKNTETQINIEENDKIIINKPNKLILPLCKCVENKELFMDSSESSDFHFCTAVDSINNKLFGCNKLVNLKEVPMLRPSNRIPYGVFCEMHKKRLIKHNCCPKCGAFCTQGSFVECQFRHHFHKDCKLFIGNNNEECCPHCGDSSSMKRIIIKMHSDKPPVFLPVQKSHHHHNSAKMSFNNNNCPSANSSDTNYLSPIISLEDMNLLRNSVSLKIDECNQQGIINAIKDNHIAKVAAILELGDIDVNAEIQESSNNGTLLHLAVLKGSLEIVFLLISNQMDVDILDGEQNSALMVAASESKNDIVNYLIRCGVDIGLKGLDGMTSLHVAAKSGNLEGLKIILNNSKTIPNFVNIQDDGGWTSLVWACENGYEKIVEYLVMHGADINIRDVEQNVALHWSAFKGSSEIVELLLNLKADINVINVHGDTPLHISAREDHYNCVIILLGRKADVSLINKNNETALDCVPKNGQSHIPLALNVQLHMKISSESRFGPCLLCNDISRGKELNPIQCYNNVDSDKEPRDFTYIKANSVITSSNKDITINTNISIMQSCTCEDKCSSNCKCAQSFSKCWYDGNGKLQPDFNFNDPPLIFECNDLCSCNSILCSNRLVQKPLNNRFQLFKTVSKGWGIRSLNSIPRGSFVCEYIGEILNDSEAERRNDDSYLFDLDNKDSDSFCIDAKFYGNFTRFINHSCEPNLHPIKVFIEHHDLKFPRIAFFARREIKRNEELSFDYGDKFWLIKYTHFTCECEADSCKYSENNIGQLLNKYGIAQ